MYVNLPLYSFDNNLQKYQHSKVIAQLSSAAQKIEHKTEVCILVQSSIAFINNSALTSGTSRKLLTEKNHSR